MTKTYYEILHGDSPAENQDKEEGEILIEDFLSKVAGGEK